MKKTQIIGFLLLIASALLLVGCGDAVEETNQEQNVADVPITTVILVDSYTVQKEAQQEVVVSQTSHDNVFLRSGVNAIVEFYNADDVSKRLVIYGTEIDVVLRPNERVEVKINTKPTVLDYIFGDEYKQIIIQ